MDMESSQTTAPPLTEFRDKCRICLKKHCDMTDALASGISNTIMELINVKITWDSELPKFICQDCKKQIEAFCKFKNLAKESDNYLKALLLAEKCFSNQTENDKCEMPQEKRNKFHKNYIRKKMKCQYYDKMYLIHVDKGNKNSVSQNEICIKDLDSENDDIDLTNFCRALIEARSREEQESFDELGENYSIDPAENFSNNILKVDWFCYQCNKCKESFQTKDCLSEHLRIAHNNELSMTSISYTCRVCAKNMDDTKLFLEHLKTHKTEGFSLLKVDGNGWPVLQKDIRKNAFAAQNSSDYPIIRNRVFKVNTDCYRCSLCQKLEPAESINNHLRVCIPDFDEEENYITFHLKFTCPACYASWIDDCENFKEHLLSHKEDNVLFVKVNILGELVDLTAEDFMFTPFDKTLEILKFGENESPGFGTDSKIVKMRSLFSCQVCDIETSSVNLLSQHYMEIHNSARPISCVCPVCCEDFKFFDLHEISNFQCHMVNHKEEGVYFLKVNSDGTIADDGPYSSGLFSDVKDLLLGKVQCPEFEFMSSISVPVVFVEKTAPGDCLNKKEGIVARLKSFAKKDNKYNKGYICEKCGKECFGKVNYKKHFLSHAKDGGEACVQKRPKCSVCDKTFSTRAILIEHKKHHMENEVEIIEDSAQTICEICGRGLSTHASLAKHRKLHAREKDNELLKCKICGRNFRRESALNRHLSAHLNPNYFECGECKLPLPSLASLERHKLGHQSSVNTHDCSVCKVSFLTKERLTAHETHTGHNQNRKRFECNVCHERFFIGREFTKHIKLHPKYKMSECALCGKRLSTMQSLMLHLDRHFESNGILCPHCGKQCFEERNYRRHLLTHKGVKPFACDVEGCDKSFYTYFEVKRHKKYHDNTRDFSCPYCPKSFHEANHLKVHIRTHTGERPYTCPHCNKSFVTRTRCKQHISLVHQGVGYDLIQSTISKKVAVFEAIDTTT